MKHIYILLFILAMVMGVSAQKPATIPGIDYKQTALHQDKTLFEAEYTIDLSSLSLSSNEMITITPRIESVNGKDAYSFPSFVVSGSKRNKILERSTSLSGQPQIAPVYVHKNKSEQTLPLKLSVGYEKWMEEAKIVFTEVISGCAECDLGKNEREFLLPVLTPYIPIYSLTYLVPEAEPVKERSKGYAAKFNYKVGQYAILPEFGDNARVISEIKDLITEVNSDKSLTITGVKITGYASPEGTSASNLLLSEKRAKGFSAFLERNYDFLSGVISVDWKGEDWDGLRRSVDASSVSGQKQILDIIDHTQNEDQRDAALKKIENGEIYRTLLSDYYPPLRRNELNINFIVKAFDVEEAKELIRTQPQYLSLNEMYLVANTYPKGSDEFKTVFDIASRLYPHDPIAQLNAATVDLEAGSLDRAIQNLEKLNTPDSWNNLAVAYAQKGESTKALELFEKAQKAGSEDALKNIEELRKSLD